MKSEEERHSPRGVETDGARHVSIHILDSPDEIAEFLASARIWELSEASVQKLSGILRLFSAPVTVLCEGCFEDAAYRDTYYAYFAQSFSVFQRDCKRFAFFLGALEPECFYRYDPASEQLLQERFGGICVIKPIRYGEVGRTILASEKLRLPPCYLRTACFPCFILGHRLTIRGFPYSSQDAETMTCAEVTIWSILEYFGYSHPEFRTALPSQIVKELEKLSDERALPSRGSEYSWMSAIFKTFGFAPRLYDLRAFGQEEEQRREFKKLFHYYVESGIPVAVGIRGRKRREELRHSVVCIGHAARRRKVRASEICYIGGETVYPYIDSAFLYEEYVLMDDNQVPYRVERPDRLTGWSESEISTFAVPLYRQVFLEAGDVSALISAVFTDDCLGIAGLVEKFGERVDQNNPLILRVFLAPSGEYQRFRAKYADSPAGATFYGSMRLPPYVWAAEISTYQSYQRQKIFGEIVIDATSGRSSHLDSLILIRYLDHLGWRTPDEDAVYAIDERLKHRTRGMAFPYEMYRKNLLACGGEEEG